MAEHDGSSASEKLTYLLIGAGIGATLALLFAPKSGRELREDIADYTRKGMDAANEGARRAGARAGEIYDAGRERVVDAYGNTREKVTDIYSSAREGVSDAYGTAREKITHGAETISDVAHRQKDQIAAAIEAGKQAYREEKRKTGELGRAAVEGEDA